MRQLWRAGGVSQRAPPHAPSTWPCARASEKEKQPTSPWPLACAPSGWVGRGCPTLSTPLQVFRENMVPTVSPAALTLTFSCSLPMPGLRAGGRGRGRALQPTSCQWCVHGITLRSCAPPPTPKPEKRTQNLGFSPLGAYDTFFLAPEVAEQELVTEKVTGPCCPFL